MERECIFIDVFTDKPYAGNQLAVFPDGTGLTSEQMQKLAKEINYSETTFIFQGKPPEYDYQVRIFTINSELPFAGHPIIGTAYAIKNILGMWPESRGELRLKTGVGVIPLFEEAGNIWMTQNKPEFNTQYRDKKEIAGLINLSPEDISDDLPVEEVDTGNNILIVPVKNLAAVRQASGNVNNLINFFSRGTAFVPYIFTLETESEQASVHTRLFAAHLGIIEDAATGSAAGPLTAYLLKYRVLGDSFNIRNEQGLEMGRPSIILMQGEVKENTYSIKIGGTCACVGRGQFTI